jgi:hypothetical protein
VLARVARGLRPGGLLLFDIPGPGRAPGFAAGTLRPGYAGEPVPPGITAYLARKRDD